MTKDKSLLVLGVDPGKNGAAALLRVPAPALSQPRLERLVAEALVGPAIVLFSSRQITYEFRISP